MLNNRKHNKGFTLVELAIVIVIIGLLVGGVLQGQELVKQAKIRNNVKRIQEINSAVATFYSKYNCIPGDCINASNFGLSYNGDGDSKIGYGTGKGSTYFWFHLVTAKMLNVLRYDGQAFSIGYTQFARFLLDKGASTNSMSGYMYAAYGDLYAGNDPDFPWGETAIAIPNQVNMVTITTNLSGGSQAYATFTANETRMMDEKMDDGNAKTGKFFGADARLSPSNYSATICSNSGVYVVDDSNLLCRILFDIGF